jgi:hypothetical protein
MTTPNDEKPITRKEAYDAAEAILSYIEIVFPATHNPTRLAVTRTNLRRLLLGEVEAPVPLPIELQPAPKSREITQDEVNDIRLNRLLEHRRTGRVDPLGY